MSVSCSADRWGCLSVITVAPPTLPGYLLCCRLSAECWEVHGTFTQKITLLQPPLLTSPLDLPPRMGFSHTVLEWVQEKALRGSGLCETLEKLLPLEQKPSGISRALQNLLNHLFFLKWSLHFKSTDWKVISFASKVISWVAEWQSRILKVRPRALDTIITQMNPSFPTRTARGFTKSLSFLIRNTTNLNVPSQAATTLTFLSWQIRAPSSEIRHGKFHEE